MIYREIKETKYNVWESNCLMYLCNTSVSGLIKLTNYTQPTLTVDVLVYTEKRNSNSTWTADVY